MALQRFSAGSSSSDSGGYSSEDEVPPVKKVKQESMPRNLCWNHLQSLEADTSSSCIQPVTFLFMFIGFTIDGCPVIQ